MERNGTEWNGMHECMYACTYMIIHVHTCIIYYTYYLRMYSHRGFSWTCLIHFISYFIHLSLNSFFKWPKDPDFEGGHIVVSLKRCHYYSTRWRSQSLGAMPAWEETIFGWSIRNEWRPRMGYTKNQFMAISMGENLGKCGKMMINHSNWGDPFLPTNTNPWEKGLSHSPQSKKTSSHF